MTNKTLYYPTDAQIYTVVLVCTALYRQAPSRHCLDSNSLGSAVHTRTTGQNMLP